MQEMSTWGDGLNATPSGKQLQGKCVPFQVRSQTIGVFVTDAYTATGEEMCHEQITMHLNRNLTDCFAITCCKFFKL